MKTFIMNPKLTSPVSSVYTSFFCPALAFHAPITLKFLLVPKCAILYGSSCELSLLSGIRPSPILWPLVRLTFIRPLELHLDPFSRELPLVSLSSSWMLLLKVAVARGPFPYLSSITLCHNYLSAYLCLSPDSDILKGRDYDVHSSSHNLCIVVNKYLN